MVKKIAIIDDDIFWINWIKSKISKYRNNIIECNDLRKFIITEDISYFDIIICDYLFIGYSLEDTDFLKKLSSKNFNGNFYLITHSPRDVKNEESYTRIFDKGAIKRNKNFTFDKYI